MEASTTTIVTLSGIKCDYALHMALKEWYSEDLVVQMIELCPKLVELPDKNGKFVLHMALQRNFSEDVLLQMIELCPKVVELPDNNGKYALHMAMMEEIYSEAVVWKMMELFPMALEEPLRFQKCGYVQLFSKYCYALHMALKRQYSENIVLKMIELGPALVVAEEIDYTYALHMAIAKEYSETVVLRLMEVFPKAIEEYNCYGEYPLHNALLANSTEIVVLKLVELFPKALGRQFFIDGGGWTVDSRQRYNPCEYVHPYPYPLQVAIIYYPQSKTLLQKMTELCPKECTLQLSLNEILKLPKPSQIICFEHAGWYCLKDKNIETELSDHYEDNDDHDNNNNNDNKKQLKSTENSDSEGISKKTKTK